MKREMKAYGKINLTLEVTGRRDDGYHLLESVITQIDLFDELSIMPEGREIALEVEGEGGVLSAGPDNLAWAAAAAFLAEAGIRDQGVRIRLKKGIPVGAGFAGGSADAAAVLTLMNEMFGSPINKERMLGLAIGLGADVPFCLSGGTALMRGVGELLEEVPAPPECAIVLCKPPFSVSAGEAYALYDRIGSVPGPGPAPMLDALGRQDLAAVVAAAFNGLEEPVVGAYPEIGAIKRALLDREALCAWMSGSGSAVFGLFPDSALARPAYDELRGRYGETFLTGPRPFG